MKIELIDKVKIKDLNSSIGNQYLSESHASGGSFLNNYHKNLPLILVGSPDSVLPDALNISCPDVIQNSQIVVEGSLVNEYLITDLVIEYGFTIDGEFTEITDRVPYAPWQIQLDAASIYFYSYSYLYIKITGIDYSNGERVELLHKVPINLEDGCAATCNELANTEAALYISSIHSEVPVSFRVVVDGKSYIAETLEDIKYLLDQEGIQVTFYEEYY